MFSDVKHRAVCLRQLSCLFVNTTDVDDPGISADVGLHEQHAGRVGTDRHGGRQQGAQFQGQVCVPARVDNERVLQPAEAVQHDEGRRQPRLQRIRHRHAYRLPTQVRRHGGEVKISYIFLVI